MKVFKVGQRVRITDSTCIAMVGRIGRVVRLLRRSRHEAWVDIEGDAVPPDVANFPQNDLHRRGNHVCIFDDECEAVQ